MMSPNREWQERETFMYCLMFLLVCFKGKIYFGSSSECVVHHVGEEMEASSSMAVGVCIWESFHTSQWSRKLRQEAGANYEPWGPNPVTHVLQWGPHLPKALQPPKPVTSWRASVQTHEPAKLISHSLTFCSRSPKLYGHLIMQNVLLVQLQNSNTIKKFKVSFKTLNCGPL